MGAGIPVKTRNARIYRLLKGIQRDLAKAGVECVYHRYSLSHHDVHDIGGGFNIHYNWSFASNGECSATPLVTIPPTVIARKLSGHTVIENRETYGGWCTQKDSIGTFEKGIERIKELFAVKKTEAPRFDYSRTCECGAPYDRDLQGFSCAD